MTRLRAIVPLFAAAVLAVIAVLTVHSAGCSDPGHYELRGTGYELVGGCIAPGDVMVPEPAPMAPPSDTADVPARS
jgi:hypothetical protein